MAAASLFLAVAAAAAGSGPPLAQPQLNPLASFAGHCWTGQASADGAVDTHCFESVYGGQHIRDRHVVTVGGKAVYRGETLYSVEQGNITFTYWSSLGGVGRGTLRAAGAVLNFDGQIRATPQSQRESMATRWRKLSNAYEVTAPDGGEPKLFRRVD